MAHDIPFCALLRCFLDLALNNDRIAEFNAFDRCQESKNSVAGPFQLLEIFLRRVHVVKQGAAAMDA